MGHRGSARDHDRPKVDLHRLRLLHDFSSRVHVAKSTKWRVPPGQMDDVGSLPGCSELRGHTFQFGIGARLVLSLREGPNFSAEYMIKENVARPVV